MNLSVLARRILAMLNAFNNRAPQTINSAYGHRFPEALLALSIAFLGRPLQTAKAPHSGSKALDNQNERSYTIESCFSRLCRAHKS